MRDKPRATVVGAFVLGAIALAIAAVALWGSGRLFERKYRYVCYFPGSVNGLSVGAPVKYRGVTIGSVRDMRIPYIRDDMRIAVIIELYAKKGQPRGSLYDPTPPAIEGLVARGLRARLEAESLVTGQLFVSLDLVPNAPRPPPTARRDALPEIPAVPSTLQQIGGTLTSLAEQLKQADLAGLAQSIERTFAAVTRLAEDPALAHALASLPGAVASFEKLSAQLARTLGTVDAMLARTGGQADTAIRSLSAAVNDLRQVAAPQGRVVVELERTLAEMRRAAESVRTLADYLQRNPNALIVGKKRP